jgi:hypothetical protein
MDIYRDKSRALAIGVTAALCLCRPVAAAEADREARFSGAYAGVNLVSQNVWGGSLVNGVDVLAQDRRTVTEFNAGLRKQTAGGWVFGVEFQYGTLDGDLNHVDTGASLSVQYRNSSQFGFGGEIGRVIGASGRNLLFLYGYETTREFDVSIQNGLLTGSQTDEQGFFRYGLGLETVWTPRIRTEVLVGTYRVDFGSQITNIDVSGESELALGLVYAF